MSKLRLHKTAIGSAPSAGAVDIFFDSADNELKYIDENANEIPLTPLGWGDWNLLMNGGFEFAQMQVPSTLTTYSSTTGRVMCADNWKLTNENASVQYQQIDTDAAPEAGINARYYGKLKKITAAGKVCLSQVVSASDSAGMRNEALRVQFAARLSVGAALTLRAAVIQLTSAGTIDTIPATFISAFGGAGTDPTFGTNLSAVIPASASNCSISGSAVSCVLTNAWQDFAFECDMGPNFKNILIVFWTNSQMSINDELCLTQVQATKEESIKDWNPAPLAYEQARIGTVFSKTFGQLVAPAQNAGLSGAIKWMSGKAGAVALGAIGHYRFPYVMRAVPTITGYSPSAADAQVYDVSAVAACTATVYSNATESSVDIACTGAAGTAVGDVLAHHLIADATI